MLRVSLLLLFLTLMLSGCNGSATEETPPDPAALMEQAAAEIRDVQTFRMLIEQTGADYRFAITLDQGGSEVNAILRRAEAQFRAPDTAFATAQLVVGGIPLSIDIFARNANQWLRLPSSPWINTAFAPEFNPAELIAEESGFQRALRSMTELEYMGEENLIDGTPVYHVRGTASGAIVKDLLVGLVEAVSDVVVDVYVHRETRLPALVKVTHPDTATEDQPEDTTWNVEIYDVNQDLAFDDPEATATP